jgi:hypothetical protein
VHCASWIDAVLERKHQSVVGSGRGPPLRQLARRSRDLGDLGAEEEEEKEGREMFLNNRYERQQPTSAPTPQGRASRLLVQQKEDVKERVKHQRRTARSDCQHSSPRYLPLRRQVVSLANPLGGPPPDVRMRNRSVCFAASKHLKGGMRKRIFKGLVISNLRRSNCDETASCPHRPCLSGWTREQGPIQSFKKQFCSCRQRNGQM